MSGRRSPLLVLREASPEDAPLLHEIMLAAYEEYRDTLIPPSGAFEETVEDVRHAVEEGGGVIAFLDGQPVGGGRFDLGPERIFIEVGRLSVLPAFRGRGIAARMLTWFEERAAALSILEVGSASASICRATSRSMSAQATASSITRNVPATAASPPG